MIHFGAKSRNALAFTLVELLVTVFTLSTLAALLMPSFCRGKNTSQSAQCFSQLRQMGVMMSIYGEDNNGWLPTAHATVPWESTDPVAWTKVLLTGRGDPQILACPSYSQIYYRSHYSYFMGARIAFVEAGGQPASVSLRRLNFPSQFIVSGDCNFPFVADDADPDNYTQDALFALVPVGHDNRVNVLFGDLHVKPARVYDPGLMTFSDCQASVSWNETSLERN